MSKYGDQVPRTDILAWYRSFLYDPHKLAGHIDFTLGKNKRDAPVIVTYDLLPDGRVENLAVRGID